MAFFLSHVNAFANEKFRDSKDMSVESSWKFFFLCSKLFYVPQFEQCGLVRICLSAPTAAEVFIRQSVANAYE